MKKKIIVLSVLAAMAIQLVAFAESNLGGSGGTVVNQTAFERITGGHTGAPVVARDAKHFGTTDKIFLGTWECTNDPHSTLTIQEADPQTGGYHADFFFYRIANADAYANININGRQLDINQGSVNDKFDFRGTFEQTVQGIRFTITESAFTYLKPGQVYEYKRIQPATK